MPANGWRRMVRASVSILLVSIFVHAAECGAQSVGRGLEENLQGQHMLLPPNSCQQLPHMPVQL